MSGSILGILAELVAIKPEWLLAFFAFVGLGFTWFQLHVLRKTSSGTFIHDLYKDFCTRDALHIIASLKSGRLDIVKNVVQTVDAAGMAHKKPDIFSEDEIVAHLLDPLEQLGALAERKLVRIDLIYDFFSWYINLVWTNDKIQTYIEQARKKPDDWDLFIRLEKLHYQCKVYGDRGTLLHDRDLLSRRASQLVGRVWFRRLWP